MPVNFQTYQADNSDWLRGAQLALQAQGIKDRSQQDAMLRKLQEQRLQQGALQMEEARRLMAEREQERSILSNVDPRDPNALAAALLQIGSPKAADVYMQGKRIAAEEKGMQSREKIAGIEQQTRLAERKAQLERIKRAEELEKLKFNNAKQLLNLKKNQKGNPKKTIDDLNKTVLELQKDYAEMKQVAPEETGLLSEIESQIEFYDAQRKKLQKGDTKSIDVSKFKKPEEIKSAYDSGMLSEQQAIFLLKEQFGMK